MIFLGQTTVQSSHPLQRSSLNTGFGIFFASFFDVFAIENPRVAQIQ
jgi:hypothetical protein